MNKAKLEELFKQLRPLFSGFWTCLKRHQIEQLRKQNTLRLELRLKILRLAFNMIPKPSKSSNQGKPSVIEATWTYRENILWHEVSETLKLALHHKRLLGPLVYLGYIITVNNFIRHVCHYIFATLNSRESWFYLTNLQFV